MKDGRWYLEYSGRLYDPLEARMTAHPKRAVCTGFADACAPSTRRLFAFLNITKIRILIYIFFNFASYKFIKYIVDKLYEPPLYVVPQFHLFVIENNI